MAREVRCAQGPRVAKPYVQWVEYPRSVRGLV